VPKEKRIQSHGTERHQFLETLFRLNLQVCGTLTFVDRWGVAADTNQTLMKVAAT